MTICAIDYDTHGADVVALDLEQNTASWRHIDFPGKDALTRARVVRDAMPSRGSWLDAGVVMVVLERPMSRFQQGLVPLMRTLGALHACLPSQLDIWELTASEWRSELGLSTNAKRAAAKAEARDFAVARWTDMPAVVSQDAFDGYAMAWAARLMCEKAAAA